MCFLHFKKNKCVKNTKKEKNKKKKTINVKTKQVFPGIKMEWRQNSAKATAMLDSGHENKV